MGRAAVTVVLLVLLGCASSEQSEPTRDTVASESSTGASTDVDPTATAICVDQRPVVPAQIGTVNTIVVPVNAEQFDGDVNATPAAACPGDAVSFIVSIVNVWDEPSVFSAGRGLVFYSGGMANWSVAPLGDLAVLVQPGERLDQTVVGTIPPVAPGTYRVGPEGSGFSGELVVLDPTGG